MDVSDTTSRIISILTHYGLTFEESLLKEDGDVDYQFCEGFFPKFFPRWVKDNSLEMYQILGGTGVSNIMPNSPPNLSEIILFVLSSGDRIAIFAIDLSEGNLYQLTTHQLPYCFGVYEDIKNYFTDGEIIYFLDPVSGMDTYNLKTSQWNMDAPISVEAARKIKSNFWKEPQPLSQPQPVSQDHCIVDNLFVQFEIEHIYPDPVYYTDDDGDVQELYQKSTYKTHLIVRNNNQLSEYIQLDPLLSGHCDLRLSKCFMNHMGGLAFSLIIFFSEPALVSMSFNAVCIFTFELIKKYKEQEKAETYEIRIIKKRSFDLATYFWPDYCIKLKPMTIL